MKALSIRQPWAWLIVHGHKDVENRTWRTDVRGDLLIHAGKAIDTEGYDWVQRTFPEIRLPRQFDLGGIVGQAVLTDCVQSLASPWFFGPHGLVLRNAKSLPFMTVRGHLGFFPVNYVADGRSP